MAKNKKEKMKSANERACDLWEALKENAWQAGYPKASDEDQTWLIECFLVAERKGENIVRRLDNNEEIPVKKRS